MVQILTVNTVGKQLDLYLQQDMILLGKINITDDNRQAELLVSKVQELLLNNKTNYKDLSALAVVVGPGSFMGLKTSIAFAKAVNAAIGTKLIAINLFEIISYNEEFSRVILKADANGYYQMDNNQQFSYVTKQELDLQDNEKIITDTLELKNNTSPINIVVNSYSYENIVALSYNKYSKGLTSNNIEALYIKPPRINKKNR